MNYEYSGESNLGEEVSKNIHDKLIDPLLAQFGEIDSQHFKNFLSKKELQVAIDDPISSEERKAAKVAKEHHDRLEGESSDELLPDWQGITKKDLSKLGEKADRFEAEFEQAGRVRDYVTANFELIDANDDDVLEKGELNDFAKSSDSDGAELARSLKSDISNAGHKIDTIYIPNTIRVPTGKYTSTTIVQMLPVSVYGVNREDLQLYPEKVASKGKFKFLMEVNDSINSIS